MVNYLIFLALNTGIFALFSLGLNLQWGVTGLINFGHVAFMTIGAYTTVLLTLQGVAWGWAMLVGMGLAALLAVILGFTTLRLREDYLAILTIGVSELVRLIALNEQWLTRGALGLFSYPLPWLENWSRWPALLLWTVLFGVSVRQLGYGLRIPLRLQRALAATAGALVIALYIAGLVALAQGDYKVRLLVLLAAALVLTFFILERLSHSPWGRLLKGIREDETAVQALGKNVFIYKLHSLILGGIIGGLSGAFYAWQLTFINPESFVPLITFQAWMIVIIGGGGNHAGTLLGALIFWLYDSVTRFVLPALLPLDGARLGALRVMIIGILLILVLVWRPQGLLGKKEELVLN
ncbi:MAG: branched-chain amino acid ABC transporter permease [Gloeomargarita sp. SKYBB_i_bin120]|nr:branched-chain amino acid ABC transporter permease [Gloeomargarita sp. SKYG98]MCS7292033.1 branched-chain amino acid ABC transporter permease [Gloeomargarita sp. SKYB120]MDW8177593.1 branched-chain amino acid ABC transporter permease [Gloeomargarita sp. SKYBB_i_bin120]